MSRGRLWRQGVSQLSAWLPALLMMLFALGSWWLVRNAPKFAAPDSAQAASKDPDYHMREFSVRSFDPSGRLKSEIIGAEGLHYPATDTLEVQQPRIRSHDAKGHPTVATAQRAWSNHDGSELQLFGDARVVREAITASSPRLEFRGEHLHAFVDEDRVRSDQPVELRRGTAVFTGNTFSYDDRGGVAELTGRVRGVLQPRR
ncbi:MAG: LPS export ABC transporter periplasmic protein LptC [Pseudomonadota bacterium]|nr:LPS export ABC transporter periplasmic protein LptC [Pseudomonadota bacterium]